MAVGSAQSLHADERGRSAVLKAAVPLEVVKSIAAKLDRSTMASSDLVSRSRSSKQTNSEPPKRPAPAKAPTQLGPKGLRFDFNIGCRVVLPEGEHPWRAPRQFERTRLITADHVKAVIKTTITGFGTHGSTRT